MANYLFKKSYQLKNFSESPYKELWGTKGIFTTIRLYGKPADLILLDLHIKQFNYSLKKFNINFNISSEKIFNLIRPNLKFKKYDHLLRIACNKKILSLSLRERIKISKNFSIKIISYKRPLSNFKHLNYKKILKLQKKINIKKEEIVFYNNNSLLEGATSNIIAVKKNILYIPPSYYYFGVTLRYLIFRCKLKIVRKKIKKEELHGFSELLLVGSGKEVTSVVSIKNNKWKRSSVKIYKKLLNTYNKLLI